MPSFLKQTSDEVEIQGGEGKSDYRRLNSYPFKVLPVCVGVLRAFLAFCVVCLVLPCLSFALWHAMQTFPGKLPGAGKSDYRRPNSYPSKVLPVCLPCVRFCLVFLVYFVLPFFSGC